MVKLVYRDREWELKPGISLRDAILKVGLDPEGVLGVREGKLITDDLILADGDVVKLIAVVSGGY
ncbi:MAG: MoaD/ThiS family protein [Chloroflexi bacterium]|nr:MoaD/ThiS family protein [Chloroflexota bacterium]